MLTRTIKISLAFKSQELKAFYIPKIIDALQKENKFSLDTLFTGAVVAKLANQGLESLQIQSKKQINTYLSGIKFKFDNQGASKHAVRSPMTHNDIVIPQAPGMWLEAKALGREHSYTGVAAHIIKYFSLAKKNDYKKYITGSSNSAYMKQAFDSEPILVDFKNSNYEFYENTAGMPTR